jgi:hypothetical protein
MEYHVLLSGFCHSLSSPCNCIDTIFIRWEATITLLLDGIATCRDKHIHLPEVSICRYEEERLICILFR